MSSLHVGAAWKLSPSDLTFLASECPRCLWQKIAGNFPRPRSPFPKVFTLLDRQTKDYFAGKRTERISPDLPPGRVVHADRWVRSIPIRVPGHERRVFIAGRIDASLRFDDGSHGIVDFKTSVPRPEHVEFYGRQLHAYALAAENPAPGNLRLSPVARLGLLCFEPTRMTATRRGAAYRGEAHWIDVPRDDDAFMAFLAEIVDVLERPSPPDASPTCPYCQFLLDGVAGFLGSWLRSGDAETPPSSPRRTRSRAHLELVNPPRANEPASPTEGR